MTGCFLFRKRSTPEAAASPASVLIVILIPFKTVGLVFRVQPFLNYGFFHSLKRDWYNCSLQVASPPRGAKAPLHPHFLFAVQKGSEKDTCGFAAFNFSLFTYPNRRILKNASVSQICNGFYFIFAAGIKRNVFPCKYGRIKRVKALRLNCTA